MDGRSRWILSPENGPDCFKEMVRDTKNAEVDDEKVQFVDSEFEFL